MVISRAVAKVLPALSKLLRLRSKLATSSLKRDVARLVAMEGKIDDLFPVRNF